MFCPRCGSPSDASPCSVCGAQYSSAPFVKVGGGGYASWGRRVGATLVDYFVLLVPTFILYAALSSFSAVIVSIASIAVQGLYLVELIARPRGQTIGNRLVGTVVRDAVTGGAVSKRQSLIRWGVVALYSIPAVFSSNSPTLLVSVIGLIDILYPFFNERKQTWHDRFAGTVVEKI